MKSAFIYSTINKNFIPLLLINKYLYINSDIYYISIDLSKQSNINIISYLEKKNIKWINSEYERFSDFIKWQTIASELTDRIWKSINQSILFRILEKLLIKRVSINPALEVMWKDVIYKYIEILAKQCAAAQELTNKKKYSRIYIISENKFLKYIKKSYNNGIIARFIPLIAELKEIALLYKKAKDFLKRKLAESIQIEKEKKINENKYSDIDTNTFEVVYFPHKGIYYGDLFIKDQFYNNNICSPFHKNKILHMSICDKNSAYMKYSYDYYKDNMIPYMDFYDIQVEKRLIFARILTIIRKINILLLYDLQKYGMSFVFRILMIVLKLLYNCQRLERFGNLKIALIGYDFLFPPELSIALMMKGVKVCASQERFIQAFYDVTSFILDYYFIAGDVVRERGLKRCFVTESYSVGLIRTDKLFDYEKSQIKDEKYDEIKTHKKLILALDYHLPSDDVENLIRSIATVEQIRGFYEDLIKLAEEFTQIHIVIKGKFRDNYSSFYIKDIVEMIESIDNINIERDLDTYNPYYIGEKADLTIACHTSLADELLAAGRKVIFYEMSDYMETYFNYYNLPLVAKDYSELRYHIKRYLEGIYLDDDEIFQLQSLYNNSYDGRVKERIQEYLQRIIEQKEGNTNV
jgi:hypothetical protein